MTPSSENSNALSLLEEFPSPTKKEKLTDQIEEVRALLSMPPKGLNINKARIKLADLLTGRNDAGDYIEAGSVYKDVLSGSLPEEAEHQKAELGEVELALTSANPEDVNRSIESCATAVDSLEEREDSVFFFIKGKLLLAELFLKRGDEKGRALALKLYDEILSNPSAHKYFKMRAIVGKLELLNVFERQVLEKNSKGLIAECENILELQRGERSDDYFFIKGILVLSEIMLWRDKDTFIKKAEGMLSEVINNERTSDDLRARASLTLAAVSSPKLARSLIKGVKHMEGLDPYILRKAKAIEDSLHE